MPPFLASPENFIQIDQQRFTARQKLKTDRKLAYAKDLVEKKYQAEIAESQA
jgi:hypothetical protein